MEIARNVYARSSKRRSTGREKQTNLPGKRVKISDKIKIPYYNYALF